MFPTRLGERADRAWSTESSRESITQITGRSEARLSLQHREAHSTEIFKRLVVVRRTPRRVSRLPLRNNHHHTLPGPRQEDAVGVLLMRLPFLLLDPLPLVPAERPVPPTGARPPEVGVPGDAGPVEFQPLDLEFGHDVFEVIRRADFTLPAEKPVHRVNHRPDVDRMRLEPLRLR